MAAIPIRWGLGKLAERAAAAAAAAEAARRATKDLPNTNTREADCSQTPQASECNQCKLGDGMVGQGATPRYIAKTNRINYDYQLQVVNMFAAPERFGYVRYGDNSNTIVNIDLSAVKDFFGTGGKYVTLEWLFGGIAFDGFWRGRCTVVETKANFGSFFDEDGMPAKPFTPVVVAGWFKTYTKQAGVVSVAKPQGKLEWHFMDNVAYGVAVQAGIPATVAHFTPYIVGRFP
ncbi:hypothetical protein C1924_08560 [Stenotrophomonas sp. ESTM1D_MKCIP4_1]|uniref:Tox-REase-5 domain-containing protein n=1 Tax=Stenotrophomonas sp. ESTM1D_MKCIP4_1 TaxID=2072414 RepID=UPI000D54225C|nr:Tox-REase-5 domain-containing protein [Stenotrophomonas sp. ESTM1D_MKCIP4_1]AWH53228.1 hypothetical protein C1924_08560 [Stenotrophomonas sp. ESTM1D_MKCIP4_1]